jgi:hypothetical protein
MIDHETEAPHNRLPPHARPTDDTSRDEQSAHDANASHGSAAELFAPLMAHLRELSEYASYYFAARSDLVKAKVRKIALYIVAGLIAAVAGATLLIVALVLVLVGIAGGLGELMGNRPWAGSLATGAIVAAIVFGSLTLLLPQWLVNSRRQVKDKYDRRRQSQRTRFGHDVDEIRKN